MTGTWWWDLLIGLVVAVLVAWAALVAVLVAVRPRGGGLSQEALPDLLRLVRRLAADPTLPRGARIRLWLLPA